MFEMGRGVKADKATPTTGSKCWKISTIFLCLMNMSTLVVPVTGFALKTCRISNEVAVCVKRELRAVPDDIPSTVKGLDLSTNQISKIHVSDFKKLSNMTELYLDKNNISQIDNSAFASLICLKELNLHLNKLVELQEGLFDGLSNLTKLIISRNYIKTVAATAFQPMTSLKVLDLSNNKLEHITEVRSISQLLPHLQMLYITRNNFNTFQSWELTNRSVGLSHLDLSQNPMVVLRITADVFPNLTFLNISNSPGKQQMILDVHNKTFLSRVSTLDISGLQMAFDDMKTLLQTVNTSLRSLRMNAMKQNLTALVYISCSIPTMSTLQLRHNKLRTVSSDMFNMCINVTELDLINNQIQIIHKDAFRALQKLRILTLSGNLLSSVPTATRNLPALEELNLNNNNISRLECEDFANQTMLRRLSLYHNSISALKDCVFKDLIRLQVLKLQTNHLSDLNSAFKKHLPNLSILYLNANQLTQIKNVEFKGLHSLQNLSLHDNQIKDLEKGCFIGLTNLTEILLQKNKVTEAELNKGVFNDLRNLRRLDLRENRIKYQSSSSLREPPFSQLFQLETLALPSQHRRDKAHLPCNFLQGLTNLLVFDMRSAQLLSLDKDMFKYTPRLQTLDISSNELQDLSSELFSPIPNLKSLYISRTSLHSLDFLINANLSQLEFLQARKNEYSVIREETIKSVPALVYVDLQGNSFTCDCDNAWFLQWVESNSQTQVYDGFNFVCNHPPDLNGKKLLDIDIQSCSVDVQFICFVSTTCVTLLFMVGSVTYHFLRWQLVYAYYLFLALLADKNQKNKKDNNQYDAFISYNIHDEPWVTGELLPKLEEEQGWRLCLHHRDFEPGKPIMDNITDAIYGSRKTICVISRKYLESEWCSREIQVASFRLFDEKKDVLILVFLEEIPTSLLSPYYRMRKLVKKKTYLSWPHAGMHTVLFWEKLGQALQTRGDLGEDLPQLTMMDRP
ncbi:toll-like receptor 13 [Anabas testudineus]|uniref:TIR domain-containing protein n=1 Tax=Anabas testudineus TaxID=64144 RepID=A0A3Q1JR22_ANATE|nr:toll-like receptor 13 [Anabas testudineus]XP_026217826.1 toll-like receptor 13 [Anabas testudineus]XP_026217827.1 toll-like receptor 13 [Anabas testudineus]